MENECVSMASMHMNKIIIFASTIGASFATPNIDANSLYKFIHSRVVGICIYTAGNIYLNCKRNRERRTLIRFDI